MEYVAGPREATGGNLHRVLDDIDDFQEQQRLKSLTEGQGDGASQRGHTAGAAAGVVRKGEGWPTSTYSCLLPLPRIGRGAEDDDLVHSSQSRTVE